MIKLDITLDDIDYGAIAEKMWDVIRADTGGSVPYGIGILKKLPKSFVRGAVAAMPESVREETAVYLLNKYKEKIIAAAENTAVQNGFPAKVKSLEVKGTQS